MTQEGKASAYNVGDPGSIPGLGRSPGEANGNPLQYSCLENPMDRGGWWATVHGIAKSGTRLSNFTSLLHFAITCASWEPQSCHGKEMSRRKVESQKGGGSGGKATWTRTGDQQLPGGPLGVAIDHQLGLHVRLATEHLSGCPISSSATSQCCLFHRERALYRHNHLLCILWGI